MVCKSSPHHSFDIQLAAEYGIEEAIIIHHFQHWIRVNKKLKRNFINGRTWSYQKIEEIAAHFPYLTEDRVREILEKLCTGKSRRSKEKEFEPILIKENFNDNKFERQLWYAFIDESMFFSKNDYEMANAIFDNGECHLPKRQMPSCNNTDTKPDTKTLNPSSSDLKKKKNETSAQASALAEEFYLALIDAHGKEFKKPDLKSWALHFDRMLRIDEREPSQIRKVMNWAVQDPFWQCNILSAEKLRKKFLQLKIKMENTDWNHKKQTKKQEIIKTDPEAKLQPMSEEELKQLFPGC